MRVLFTQVVDALNLEADPYYMGAKMSEWVIVKKAKPGGFHKMRAHFLHLYAVRTFSSRISP